MTTALLAAATVRAQSVTYNHDAPKRNQITVMETGTGALTPEFYYTLPKTSCRSAHWPG